MYLVNIVLTTASGVNILAAKRKTEYEYIDYKL